MILNIIDKIYENPHFTTILLISIILLIILFIVVLILGLRDARKSREPQEEKKEIIKDITFEEIPEEKKEQEEVTFEMPTLTKNLEDFKKNLEEEIQKEGTEVKPIVEKKVLNDSAKPVKILDMKEIEDTSVISLEELDNKKKNEVKEKKNKIQSKQKKSETKEDKVYNLNDDF